MTLSIDQNVHCFLPNASHWVFLNSGVLRGHDLITSTSLSLFSVVYWKIFLIFHTIYNIYTHTTKELSEKWCTVSLCAFWYFLFFDILMVKLFESRCLSQCTCLAVGITSVFWMWMDEGLSLALITVLVHYCSGGFREHFIFKWERHCVCYIILHEKQSVREVGWPYVLFFSHMSCLVFLNCL